MVFLTLIFILNDLINLLFENSTLDTKAIGRTVYDLAIFKGIIIAKPKFFEKFAPLINREAVEKVLNECAKTVATAAAKEAAEATAKEAANAANLEPE